MYRKLTKRTIAAVLTALMMAAVAVGAEATYWQHDPAEPGDWFDAANWTAGVPASDLKAYVDNGGTALISSGQAEADSLFPGYYGIGAVEQVGGNLATLRLGLGYGPGSQGSYGLSAGGLSARHVWVGADGGAGQFTHSGGSSNITVLLSVGCASHEGPDGEVLPATGAYDLSGGSVSTNHTIVGDQGGSGQFTQSGGTHTVAWRLDVGRSKYSGPTSEGSYVLSGGLLCSNRTRVGAEGIGTFTQAGGLHTVEDVLEVGGPVSFGSWDGPVLFPIDEISDPFIGGDQLSPLPAVDGAVVPSVVFLPPAPSQGRYELSGGALSSRQEGVNRTGVFRQVGGVNTTRHLLVSGGRYEYLGGVLEIDCGLDLKGVLDFHGSSSILRANGLVNLGEGELLASGNASLIVGADSLVILPAGFDPYAQFGHFQTDGLIHHAGTDLVLSAGEGFTGWGAIDDHVRCGGTIRACPDGKIDLNRGLYVSDGGAVDLGSGRVIVRNERSGMSGGTLSAEELHLGGYFSAWPLVFLRTNETDTQLGAPSEQDIVPSLFVPSLFRQTGGEAAIAGELRAHYGTYELTDGVLSAGHVSIGGARFGPSRFRQTGGSATFGSLSIAGGSPWVHPVLNDPATDPIDWAEILYLPPESVPFEPWSPISTSVYELSGGSLTAGHIDVGGMSRSAMFIQTGGRSTIQQALTVGGSGGTYMMYGGNLSVSVLEVGRRYMPGTFAIVGPDAAITVADLLLLGEDCTFTAVPGSVIRMWGASFQNESTDPAALAGLSNLTLIFEEGPDVLATFEVAGEDRGEGLAGFFENFALDTLQIGGVDVGQVQLVDLLDNQPDWQGAEALYVENLILGPGSFLDLNGLKLYYLQAEIDPAATILGGLLAEGLGLPGDANLDGRVDGTDYTCWADHYQMTGVGWSGGDFNDDGIVDGGDYTCWADHYSRPLGGAPVPEPAAVGLLAAGGLGVLLRRGRRKCH